MNKTRQPFTHSAIIDKIHSSFEQATGKLHKPNPRQGRLSKITDPDCLMSGLAIFSLKYPSLLQFEVDRVDPNLHCLHHNLTSLYKIKNIPCDTYLRERLDDLPLDVIRPAFASLISTLQRGKVLEEWKFLDNKFLISLDGSGFFSSNEIHCNQCCEKVLHKGTDRETITYQHQMLVGSIVSPLMKQVLPIAFEPIVKEDGQAKNDCERNCAKRWLKLFREDHQQMPVCIVADGLYSNAPFIKALRESRCSYILVAKEDDHKYMYDYFRAGSGEDIGEYSFKDKAKNLDQFYRFMNDVPLNEANHDLKVNVLYYEEINQKSGKKTKWLWVTDTRLTNGNVKSIMKAGRSRWKIENETFNTLKTSGYNFEHNYGHGYNGLSNLFAGLMLLAFTTDQILEATNRDYQRVRARCGSRRALFEKIRVRFEIFMIESFERLYEAMVDPPEKRWL